LFKRHTINRFGQASRTTWKLQYVVDRFQRRFTTHDRVIASAGVGTKGSDVRGYVLLSVVSLL